MTTLTLRSNAWHGDAPLPLSFPDHWDVTVLGDDLGAALSPAKLRAALDAPIAAPSLDALLAGAQRVALIVDDLTRPTPAADVLPHLFAALAAAGVQPESIVVVSAGGTHTPATLAEIALKTGPLPAGVRVVAHDSARDLIDCGKTRGGLPLWVNREIMACDVKIGVGCIYPHPAAGFSGGAKILVPGACGMETVRALHDDLQSADRRGGSLESEMRLDLEDAARRLGLNWIVNGLLNHERKLVDVVAGDPVAAHQAGVARARARYGVRPLRDAEVVVADVYPFDADLQFSADRGLWPLSFAGRDASRVMLAACPRGVGKHDLYPVRHALGARVLRRLRRLNRRDFRRPLEKARNLAHLMTQSRVPLLALAPGLSDSDLAAVFPRARRFDAWEGLRAELERRHGARGVRVAVYRCAPLLLAQEARG